MLFVESCDTLVLPNEREHMKNLNAVKEITEGLAEMVEVEEFTDEADPEFSLPELREDDF